MRTHDAAGGAADSDVVAADRLTPEQALLITKATLLGCKFSVAQFCYKTGDTVFKCSGRVDNTMFIGYGPNFPAAAEDWFNEIKRRA